MRKDLLRAFVTIIFAAIAWVPTQLGAAESLIENPEVSGAIAVFDAWCQYTMSNREQPAVSIGIVYDQDLVWAKGYGHADLEKKIPPTQKLENTIKEIKGVGTVEVVMASRAL